MISWQFLLSLYRCLFSVLNVAASGAVETHKVIGCDQARRGIMNALHEGFAGHDGPICHPTDGCSGRTDGLCKGTHRSAFSGKEVIEFHYFHSYVFRK